MLQVRCQICSISVHVSTGFYVAHKGYACNPEHRDRLEGVPEKKVGREPRAQHVLEEEDLPGFPQMVLARH